MTIASAAIRRVRARNTGRASRLAGMGRFLIDKTVVLAATVLPRRVTVALIAMIAHLEQRLSSKGRAAVVEARIICGRRGSDIGRLARSHLTVRYRDLLDLQRVARGRDSVGGWTIEEVNSGPVHEVLDRGQSIVVASGHWAYGSLFGLASLFPDFNAVGVTIPEPPFRWDGETLRERLLWGVRENAKQKLLDDGLRSGSVDQIKVGELNVQDYLLQSLSKPRGAAAIFIDIFWERPNARHFPFCGWKDQPFALGATRIARLARCPVVLVVPERTGPRALKVHYGTVFPPPAPNAKADDEVTMRALLKELECYVGTFRGDYPGPVGWQRRWDAGADMWVAEELHTAASSDLP
jgi:hypothetical protein